MWQVVNRTPFKAEGYFVRDTQGFEHWVVALRATFSIRTDGLLEVSSRQEEVYLGPYYADDEAEELAVESDIAPFRPRTDLIVWGEVVAENRSAYLQQDFMVQVGAFRKNGSAFGGRWICRKGDGWGWHHREETNAVPLSWRMAFGGPDPLSREGMLPRLHDANPIGKGWSPDYSRATESDIVELPQIENPACYFHPERAPLPEPHGFGPVQPSWRPRRIHAGTYDPAWERDRAPMLPEDFSNQYHQAAPPDQVLDLRGGEPVILQGLHPDGTLRFTLPRAFFRATTFFGRERPSARMRLIGVHLNTEEKQVEMTWNASLPCNGRDHEIDKAVIVMKQLEGVK